MASSGYRRAGDDGQEVIIADPPPDLLRLMERDQRFFVDHPWRRFRVRPATAIELQHAEDVGTGIGQAPNGLAWFVALRRLSDTARGRALFLAPVERAAEPEPDEDLSRVLYERTAASCPFGRDMHDRAEEAARDASRGRVH